jgi:hypothetical protein
LSIYVNKNNGFQQAEPITRECPHCGAQAQMLAIATPSYEALMQTRPRRVGIVFRCAACNEPRFARATVRAFEPDRVELAANLFEIERTHERFQYSYLPNDIERLLREALECYTGGLHNAFASMCRRTVQQAIAGLDDQARRRWRDSVQDVLRIGAVDTPTAATIESVLFGEQANPPEIGSDESAVLIEVVKDLLYQTYVRTAKLQAAMKMRRFFAGESTRNVTPIDRGRRELA